MPETPTPGCLTGALKDVGSPLRRHMETRFPELHRVQANCITKAGRVKVPLGTCNPGTLGSAFDWAIRRLVDPHTSPALAVRGFGRRTAPLAAAISAAWDVATAHPHNPRSSVHRELLVRAAWAMALGTEVYRLGRVVPDSPLRPLLHGGATVDQVLALAPGDAVLELGSLLSVARRRLLPRLSNPTGQLVLGPEFDGSQLIEADGDIILDDCLLDLKSSIGGRRTDGSRYCQLLRHDLYQPISYALLDRSDRYGIRRIALYYARYGSFQAWDLSTLLVELGGGRPVDLDHERQTMWDVLAWAQESPVRPGAGRRRGEDARNDQALFSPDT